MKLARRKNKVGRKTGVRGRIFPKKNTLYRKLRALDLHTDRLQQKREIIPSTVDETERKCSNCGHVYTGRVCPQCGQVGTWARYTWKRAFLNFLDIWGLGNRPMFRTLRELFWRPGYMVRDYLNGHRQFYFPPFKLLALSVVFMIFISWVTGVEAESFFSGISDVPIEKLNLHGPILVLGNALLWFFGLLSRNLLYEWLFVAVIEVLCVYVAFKSVSRYNLVETYIFLVFVLSLVLLCNIPEMMGTWLVRFLKAHSLMIDANATASAPPSPVAPVLTAASGIVSTIYNAMVIFLELLCFRQFYGLKWKTTIWRLLLSLLVGIGALALALFIYGSIASENGKYIAQGLLWIVLIPAGFMLAHAYMKRNKTLVSATVIALCKIAMLSLLFLPVLSIQLSAGHYSTVWSFVAVVLYMPITLVLSMLPIALYKKRRNIWIAALPLLPLIALVVGVCLIP